MVDEALKDLADYVAEKLEASVHGYEFFIIYDRNNLVYCVSCRALAIPCPGAVYPISSSGRSNPFTTS